MSLPAFNQFMLLHKDKFTDEKNILALEYIDLFERNPRTHSPNEPEEFMRINSENAFKLLKRLHEARRDKGDQWNLMYKQQEDVYEGMLLMLDTIGQKIEELFHVRYKCKIRCRQCKHQRNVGPENKPDYEEPPELVIDLSEANPNVQDSLETKEDIENYIKSNVQFPRDYKCEKCGAENSYNKETKVVQNNVMQVYSLARLSEVLVLLFKKYDDNKPKPHRFFPPVLEFRSRTGTLTYKLVAQIEHAGKTQGGHYYAKCLRPKPLGLHSNRKKKAEEYIKHHKTALASPTLKEKDRAEIEGKIKKYTEALEENEKMRADPNGVFLLNDAKAQFDPVGFVPTPNTYVVFYHLFPSP